MSETAERRASTHSSDRRAAQSDVSCGLLSPGAHALTQSCARPLKVHGCEGPPRRCDLSGRGGVRVCDQCLGEVFTPQTQCDPGMCGDQRFVGARKRREPPIADSGAVPLPSSGTVMVITDVVGRRRTRRGRVCGSWGGHQAAACVQRCGHKSGGVVVVAQSQLFKVFRLTPSF